MTTSSAAAVIATGTFIKDEDLQLITVWLTDRHQAMIDDLDAYVSHETPSNDGTLLTVGLDWIHSWVVGRLATAPAVRRVDGAEHGDVLLLDLPGSDGATDNPVLLLCHYDTVHNAGALAVRPFTLSGSRATGPGVFDMKAGLVQAVWALAALDTARINRPPVRILLNGDEELGSVSSRPVIEREAADARCVLVLEPATGPAVKTSRKGVGIYTLDINGVESHAGLDPTRGASAIDELARIILQLKSFADADAGTTVNIGTVSGGTRHNVVAGQAHATIDVRVKTQAEADRIDRAFGTIKTSDARITVRLTGGWNRPVMERTPAIAGMYQLAATLARRLGFTLPEAAAGGGSDGNFLAGSGIALLDGLGPVGDGAHAPGEWIDVSAMPVRAALVASLVAAFATVGGAA